MITGDMIESQTKQVCYFFHLEIVRSSAAQLFGLPFLTASIVDLL